MYRFCTAVCFLSVVLCSCESAAKQQAWVEVRSTNFIVVSNAGEKQARQAASQFEQIRAVFRQSLQNASKHPSPLVTILAVKDENSMRDLLPEYWTKDHSHPAGLFITRLNQFFAAVQLDAPGLNRYETFYHEYYHAISTPYVPDLPVWLSEGLAEFYGHTEITENSANMGQADSLLLQELRNTNLIPLKVLFRVDQSSPYYNEANKTSIFYAESWALTHYLTIGDRMAHRAMLDAYLSVLDRGKSPDQAASLAFGDLDKLESDLRAYIRSQRFFYLKVPAPKTNEDEMKFRNLSGAEAAAYRGGFAVIRGRYRDGAAILNEALQLDPSVALAHEYLAMDEFLEGQRDKALESASKAVALDSKDSFTRYLRAYLQTNGGGMGSSDPQIEEDLRQAISISPDFAPPYGLLAVYFAAANRNLNEALTLAEKAVSLEPANSNYQLALAQVLIRQNKFSEADVAAGRASAWARDPSEKTNADNFRQFLDRFRQLQTEMAAAGAGEPQILTPQDNPANSPSDGSSMPKLRRAGDGPPGGVSANPFTATILRVQSNLTLLSNPMGVDFSHYFMDLMAAIRQNLMSSVGKFQISEPKDIALELAISKDGSISGIRIASGSGDDALDQATQSGISASSPLPALPAAFKGQSLKVRLRLSYSQERN